MLRHSKKSTNSVVNQTGRPRTDSQQMFFSSTGFKRNVQNIRNGTNSRGGALSYEKSWIRL